MKKSMVTDDDEGNEVTKISEQVIESQMQNEFKKMSYKSSSGGIPIDSLPLNWSKQKNIA